MEDVVEELTRGNVTEVKLVLASVAATLAIYQLVLIAIGYGKLRPPVPGPDAASFAHRFSGGVIATLVTVVALMCISYFGFEEGESAVHMVAGAALLGVLAVKVWAVEGFIAQPNSSR